MPQGMPTINHDKGCLVSDWCQDVGVEKNVVCDR